MSTLKDVAREFLEKVSSELDPYTKRDGIIQEEDGRMVLLTPSHIQFARYGRGPGKKPPLDAIEAWVKEKGIILENSDSRGTAFAFQAAIGANGTQNWVQGAPNALEEALTKNFEEYNKKLNDKFAVEISNEVNNTLKKLYPPTREFKI